MKRPTILIFMLLLAITVVGLFHVSNEVQNLKKDLVEINRQVALGKGSIHVLKAEWAYLNEPARIKKLADRYLDLTYTSVAQLKNNDEIRTAYLVKSKRERFVSVTPTLRPTLSSF